MKRPLSFRGLTLMCEGKLTQRADEKKQNSGAEGSFFSFLAGAGLRFV
jgi:hypothetical protein